MNIVYREIEKKDNEEIAALIRKVFREFKIDRPGTVYFDPTTDDLSLFSGNQVQYTGSLKIMEPLLAAAEFFPHPDYRQDVLN